MRCRATSPDGATDPEPAVRGWDINTVPPWINASATLNSDNTASVSFYGAYSYPVWNCKIDDGSAVPCTAPFVTPVLAPGSHTVTVTSPDDYGNVGSAVVAITVPNPVVPPAPGGGTGGAPGAGGSGGTSGSGGGSAVKPTPPDWAAPTKVAGSALRKSGVAVSVTPTSAGELLGTLKVKKGSSYVKLGAGSVQFAANEPATLKIRLSKAGAKFVKSQKKKFSAILTVSYYAGGQTTVLGDAKVSIKPS
jgi:hypothetical protein